jgi:hypothetical protein
MSYWYMKLKYTKSFIYIMNDGDLKQLQQNLQTSRSKSIVGVFTNLCCIIEHQRNMMTLGFENIVIIRTIVKFWRYGWMCVIQC